MVDSLLTTEASVESVVTLRRVEASGCLPTRCFILKKLNSNRALKPPESAAHRPSTVPTPS